MLILFLNWLCFERDKDCNDLQWSASKHYGMEWQLKELKSEV